jgi:hypothetical protein
MMEGLLIVINCKYISYFHRHKQCKPEWETIFRALVGFQSIYIYLYIFVKETLVVLMQAF